MRRLGMGGAGILGLLLAIGAFSCGQAPNPSGGADAGVDAGPTDAGLFDAGTPDGGPADAGLPDAGTDAGPNDAGSSLAIPPPPPGTAYWGAWINPDGNASTEEAQTAAFEQDAGRRLALHMHYFGWAADFAASADVQADLTHHRTPVVTWSCGPDNALVAAGGSDAVLAAAATSVKAFPAPMFIRWNWEMNLPGANKCMGDAGSPGYVAAWRHIHDFFADAGVTNVAWLWNPAAESSNGATAAPYWPGVDYVDWIGFDGYDKPDYVDADAGAAFKDVFQPFYDFYTAPTYSRNGAPLPMLIGETGECQADSGTPPIQAEYLRDALRDVNQGLFPDLGGFMYFDATGQFSRCPYAPANGWVLDSLGGRAAFIGLGRAAAFDAGVPGS